MTENNDSKKILQKQNKTKKRLYHYATLGQENIFTFISVSDSIPRSSNDSSTSNSTNKLE